MCSAFMFSAESSSDVCTTLSGAPLWLDEAAVAGTQQYHSKQTMAALELTTFG